MAHESHLELLNQTKGLLHGVYLTAANVAGRPSILLLPMAKPAQGYLYHFLACSLCLNEGKTVSAIFLNYAFSRNYRANSLIFLYVTDVISFT